MTSSDKKIIGLYPGTFDPITKGHLHIIQRASKLVDRLIVSVAHNMSKKPSFTLKERMDMVETDISNLPHKHCEIDVQAFDTLLIDFARQCRASCIIRGLRAVSDFEYEFQMTGMNARLEPEIETVFLMASDKWQFVSSSFIKEIAFMQGDISDFVTPYVFERIEHKKTERKISQ